MRHIDLTGRLSVNAPPARAFAFFTPEGERDWVPGWEPEYLHPDDGALGERLTFRTRHQHGQETLWLVSRCDIAGGEIEYVRVTPGSRIGTVSVRCAASSATATDVSVTYRLTALSTDDEPALSVFAAEFPEMLASWERSIGLCLMPATDGA